MQVFYAISMKTSMLQAECKLEHMANKQKPYIAILGNINCLRVNLFPPIKNLSDDVQKVVEGKKESLKQFIENQI